MTTFTGYVGDVATLPITSRWGHRCKRIKGIGPAREMTARAPRYVVETSRVSWLTAIVRFIRAFFRALKSRLALRR